MREEDLLEHRVADAQALCSLSSILRPTRTRA